MEAVNKEAATLASCYRESIRLADDHGIRSLAFPSISTGAYGYPVREAAEIAIKAVVEALAGTTHLNWFASCSSMWPTARRMFARRKNFSRSTRDSVIFEKS